MHADLVRPGGLRLDRVGVDVLKELEATVAVWRLEHRDVGMVAVEADGGVGPLSTDRVTSENGQPEVSEEGDRRFQVADGDADVLQLDAHALHATESGRRVQVRELPVPAQPDKELSRSCAASGPATGTRSREDADCGGTQSGSGAALRQVGSRRPASILARAARTTCAASAQ